SNRRANARPPRRRRPDRADRRLRAAVGEAPQAGDTQGLRRFAPWHVYDTRRGGQCCPPRFLPGVTVRAERGTSLDTPQGTHRMTGKLTGKIAIVTGASKG